MQIFDRITKLFRTFQQSESPPKEGLFPNPPLTDELKSEIASSLEANRSGIIHMLEEEDFPVTFFWKGFQIKTFWNEKEVDEYLKGLKCST